MKIKKASQKKTRVGVGAVRRKAVLKELRKLYGPMLKRLAN